MGRTAGIWIATLAMLGCALAPGAGEPSPVPASGVESGEEEDTLSAYEKVVPDDADTREGLITLHRVEDDLLFELPLDLLGRDLLVVPRLAMAPPVGSGSGPYGGQQVSQDRVIRFERRGDRVLVREVRYDIVADPSTPISRAVATSNYGAILGSFEVEATSPDSTAVVVDVTDLFLSPPPELSPGSVLPRGPDASRSFIDRVAAYPENVEVKAVLTAAPPPGANGAANRTTSMVVHWSWVKLPDEPMRPRLWDSRVGYYQASTIDFGRPTQGAESRSFITRYRLEKRNPDEAISEPVEPITYYVDPATPEWLVPWVKAGVESWQPAFESAGFRNGIVARDAPSEDEDPDWSPEDARYSVIRWLPSTIENAQGPHVHDPRSGEIIEADIYMYHNVMTLLRSWYFTHVGHLDERALEWPFPEELMGRLVEYVVAHEVGHTLGFPHNQKASSAYPVDSLRSASFVERMGFTPTLMDYSRHNYVAQPEDGIPIETLTPGIGPYDHFVTRWGYAPIPEARTPDEELPVLDAWARVQDTVPWLRWDLPDSEGSDPGDHFNAVGDADPVRATGLGVRNIRRLVPLLTEAAETPGASFDDLRLLYVRLVGQWVTEMIHVADVVGGSDAQEKHWGQEGVRYHPLPASRQREAVAFLLDEAFTTPDYLLDQEVLRRIEVEGALARVSSAQRTLLTRVLDDRRLERVIEFAAIDDASDAYELHELVGQLTDGIWSELSEGSVRIETPRRELQRVWLEIAEGKVHPVVAEPPPGLPPQLAAMMAPARSTSDVQAEFRAGLVELRERLEDAMGRTGDPATRAHVRASIDRIEGILEEGRDAR